MKRRNFVQHAGLAGVLAAGVAPAVVHAQAAVRWRLASSFPKSLDNLFGVAEAAAKQVSEMSGGKFVISTHAAGELVPALGVLDAVQNGTIECTQTAPYYFFGKDPTFGLGGAIPFGMNSRQMSAWMLDGNGLKLMREFYAGYNVINFPMGNTGAQMAGWFRKEIKSLADIKGLKMRIGGFGGTVLARLGAVPQNIPPGEIYTALEKGTIDAAEFIGPYDDERLGLNKVAPIYHYPGWWKAVRRSICLSTTRPTRRFPLNTKPFWPRLAAPRTPRCRHAMTPAIRPRSSVSWPVAPSWCACPKTS